MQSPYASNRNRMQMTRPMMIPRRPTAAIPVAMRQRPLPTMRTMMADAARRRYQVMNPHNPYLR